MKTCTFRFYAELNDFLPPERRQVSFTQSFYGQPTVKDLIEAAGVPHTEVDLVLVNGCSADFARCIHNGDRIAVYPVFETLDISPLLKVRPEPLRETRFILDTHLGRLAAYLRMLGFDTLYDNYADDEVLAAVSAAEKRILLTRDLGLLKRGQVTHGYWVRSLEPSRQLREVLHRFDLIRKINPFSRCLRCNDIMEKATKEEVAGSLPPRILEWHREFRICRTCRRVFWKGTHYDNMRRLIDEIQGDLSRPDRE